MSKLEELNLNSTPTITDEDYRQWKSSWNGIDPLPEKIHDYMNRVALPAAEKAIAKLESVLESL